MFSDDSLHGIESQARALAHTFRREERFKDVSLNLGRDAGAIISDLNYYATIVAVGSHSKRAGTAHRVDGVIDEVGPDLI